MAEAAFIAGEQRAEGIGKAAKATGYVIAMTACVDPTNGPGHVMRRDPSIRLADYADALRFWLAYPDQRLRRIVFIENTGYPLDALQRVAAESNPLGKDVEFISVRCNTAPPGVTYGYSELAMLDLGLAQSRLAAGGRYWIKATGRLKFPNVSRLLNRLPEEFLFAIDCRDNTRFVRTPQHFATTQLMVISADFYRRELFDVKRHMSRELPFLEFLLWDRLQPYRGKPGAIMRWPVNVDPVGQAAHWNKNYNSTRQRTLNLARSVCRRMFPNWWV